MPMTEDDLKNLSTEHLLEVIVEESAELIHAVQKVKRFGLMATAPNGTHYDNLSALMLEGAQVSMACRIWGARHGINWEHACSLINQKARSNRSKGFGS